MNIIFVSTTLNKLQNLPKLNFSESFQDDDSPTSFNYSIINENNTVFIVSSNLTSFLQNRLKVYEYDKFDALREFIEKKIFEILQNNQKLTKSFYAFHSHQDIFDDENFTGKSSYLSDASHIVWGFTHQGADEIYKHISSSNNLPEIAKELINIMDGNAQSE